eukprot:365730-Chlamydomonas_euryale.AAC.1
MSLRRTHAPRAGSMRARCGEAGYGARAGGPGVCGMRVDGGEGAQQQQEVLRRELILRIKAATATASTSSTAATTPARTIAERCDNKLAADVAAAAAAGIGNAAHQGHGNRTSTTQHNLPLQQSSEWPCSKPSTPATPATTRQETEDGHPIQGPLATWVERETAGCMLQHLLLGFELDLYEPKEYVMIYWYIDALASARRQVCGSVVGVCGSVVGVCGSVVGVCGSIDTLARRQ